ncbi:MAG: hypothetical protein ABFS32_04650 [Bacteroidota bacterium]
MNLSQLTAQVAKNVNGTHTPYDENKSFIVIPTDSKRYQSVLAEYVTKESVRYIEVSSKICDESQIPDKLFKIEKELTFAKLAIKEGYLQTVCYMDENMNLDLATAIINEVANFADEQELAITGEDVF